MMSASLSDDHKRWLTAERSFNEDYVRWLKERGESLGRMVRSQSRPRNLRWNHPDEGNERYVIEPGPLYGRVVLETPTEGVARCFYIGPLGWLGPHGDYDGDYIVVHWASDPALLFFGRRQGVPMSGSTVLAWRTFVPRQDDIVDFVDDGEPAAFRDCEALRQDFPVPPPPSTSLSHDEGIDDRDSTPHDEDASVMSPNPSAGVAKGQSEFSRSDDSPLEPTTEGNQPVGTGASSHLDSVVGSPEGAPPPEHTGVTEIADDGNLRARDAVIAALERPRTGRLGPVLATMQADQYELVTWPNEVPLIIEGSPGTGKTVIAVHRAAYLVAPERGGGTVGKVLLVGPTRQYVHHVSESLGKLTTGDVRVTSLREVLETLGGLRKPATDERGDREDWVSTSLSLASLVDHTASALRMAGRFGRSPALDRKVLYEELRSRSPLVRSLCEDEDLWSWLGTLESLAVAETKVSRLPLLAYIGVTASVTSTPRFDHLVVDEGQDIGPLEWRVLLDRLHRSDHVTILGDLNQRRSVLTSSTWSELIRDLGLDVGGREPDIRTITTGYRTTRQILEYANQLLPRGKRTVAALRDGPPPRVVKVAADTIDKEAVEQAIGLAKKFPTGQIAVITTRPSKVSDLFRVRGWGRPPISDGWTSEGMTVLVLTPNRARGLEFDGVIVIEPSVVPTIFEHYGALYTSLTRAVKELVVVHSRALPPPLRNQR